MRFALLLLAGVLPVLATPRITVEPIPVPAAPDSLAPVFATAADGTVWASWIEPVSSKPRGPAVHRLRVASFDASAGRWEDAHTAAEGATVAPNSADTPKLAVDGGGTLHALWPDGQGRVMYSQSAAAGRTWSAPVIWAGRNHPVEMLSLTRLENGKVLAAWLDGRGQGGGGGRQQLFARVMGAPEADEQSVDRSVCDCCQTSLAAFYDGGAILAYRGRSSDEIRDIYTARFDGTRWSESRPINPDAWRIKACPINGPRIASDGARLAAAWFTGAGSTPRVLASFSPDAGARWLAPLPIDRGHPAGHVDTVILKDGALLVTWLETDGSLWLRRITPEYSLTEPVRLATGVARRAVPRMALRRDYEGGQSAAELLVAFTRDGADAGIRTLRVLVPEGELLGMERNCNCTPSAEELQSIPIRGRVRDADPAMNIVRVSHAEVPGVFAAGTNGFLVEPLLLANVRTGAEFLGRVVRRDRAWWLIEMRWLDASPAGLPPR